LRGVIDGLLVSVMEESASLTEDRSGGAGSSCWIFSDYTLLRTPLMEGEDDVATL
jgi:hypothetical protein